LVPQNSFASLLFTSEQEKNMMVSSLPGEQSSVGGGLDGASCWHFCEKSVKADEKVGRYLRYAPQSSQKALNAGAHALEQLLGKPLVVHLCSCPAQQVASIVAVCWDSVPRSQAAALWQAASSSVAAVAARMVAQRVGTASARGEDPTAGGQLSRGP
jgi:hypothetical protein